MISSIDDGGNMRTDNDKAREFLFPNLNYLMIRSLVHLVSQGSKADKVIELLDKELKIANCALKSKKKPDYQFETIRVNFKRVRSGSITISSVTGFTINILKAYGALLDEWVDIPTSARVMHWQKHVRIGNKDLGYSVYRVVGDEQDEDSISSEMRRRHRTASSYDILIGVADKFLEIK